MKRILSLLITVLMLLSVVTACNQDAEESAESQAESSENKEESAVNRDIFGELAENPEFEACISIGKTYKCNQDAGESYPDSYLSELTDGYFATENTDDYNESAYSGYSGAGILTVTIDLGELREDIYKFTVGFLATTKAGITPPRSVRISASADNKKFETIGNAEIPQFVAGQRQEAVLVSERYVKARYIKLNISKSGWLFLDEIGIYANINDSSASEEYLAAVNKAYSELGTVGYQGGNAPDKTKPLSLISQSKSYTMSHTPIDGFKDDNKYLTDGKAIGVLEHGNYVGFAGGESVNITVDLGEVRDDLSVFRLNCYSNPQAGHYLPVAVSYAVSTDGKEFADVGRIFGVASNRAAYDFPLILQKCASGRYVRFTLEATETNRYLIEEAAVYAYSENSGNSIYPPIVYDTEPKDWKDPSRKQTNLLLGLQQQIYIPADIKPADSNYSPYDTDVITDGDKAGSNDIHNGCFYKFVSAAAPIEFIFDLGATSSVKEFSAQFTHLISWGVKAPNAMTVYLSEDSVNWYLAGTADIEPKTDNELVDAKLTLASPVKARYVCFYFMTSNWFGVSELQAIGYTDISNTRSLENSGFINRNDASLGYLAPDKDILNGIKDLCLLYHGASVAPYTAETLLPYLAYVDKDGKCVDTMFDSFLFLMSGNFPSGNDPNTDHTASDLDWTLESLFADGQNIKALDEAAGRVKQELGLDSDYKYGFTVSLYSPAAVRNGYGDINGDGKSDNIASLSDRVKAIERYMNAFEAKYAEYDFRNIEFIGYYWYHESISPENDGYEIVNATADAVHKRGYDFFWIPWYCAPGIENWNELGFDAVCMQPNYVFQEDVPDDRIEKAAYTIQNYGMGIEIEIGSNALRNETLYRRYIEYLAGGNKHGYITDCIHMYYQEIDVYYTMAYSAEESIRRLYDLTYMFIKGTLDSAPAELAKQTLTAKSDTPVCGRLLENVPEHYVFEIAEMPQNGSVSVSSDGNFIYLPEKGFTGVVSFGYTYNEGMGDSEICYVEIAVE